MAKNVAHLSYYERELIAEFRAAGRSIGYIAEGRIQIPIRPLLHPSQIKVSRRLFEQSTGHPAQRFLSSLRRQS